MLGNLHARIKVSGIRKIIHQQAQTFFPFFAKMTNRNSLDGSADPFGLLKNQSRWL